jgi:hypothetical protein
VLCEDEMQEIGLTRIDRRDEWRFVGSAAMTVVNLTTASRQVDAIVVDVSRNGLRIGTNGSLTVGDEVQVNVLGYSVVATVVTCGESMRKPQFGLRLRNPLSMDVVLECVEIRTLKRSTA